MKFYYIVALTCSGVGRKIHRGGDVVPENEFVSSESIAGFLASKHIREATKEEIAEMKKEKGMSEGELQAKRDKENAKATKEAEKQLDEIKSKYAALTGIKVEEINKTWGYPKLDKEIKAIEAEKSLKEQLEATYREAAGDDAEDTADWDSTKLQEEITKITNAKQAREGLETKYKELFADDAEDVTEWTNEDLKKAIEDKEK